MPGLEESRRGAQELAGLAVTIALSVFGSLILLFAAAGVALARHRKTPNPTLSEPATDTGLYRFYAEEPLPGKKQLTKAESAFFIFKKKTIALIRGDSYKWILDPALRGK